MDQRRLLRAADRFLDQIRPGEDMVEEPFRRLAARGELLAHRHDGFWAPMDTLKDKQCLETLHESGQAPWQVWNTDPAAAVLPAYAVSG